MNPSKETVLNQSTAGWLRFHARKSEVRRRYPKVWNIPLLRKRNRLLDGLVKEGARVLDVGAGDRTWEAKVREAAPGVEYRSYDPDRRTTQDYHVLDEVAGGYDLILLIEVIEHLPFEEGVGLLQKLRHLLVPGGNLLLTTPNTHHPTQYWQDPTHRTPWAYDFLGGVMLELGYEGLRYHRLLHAKRPLFLALRALGRLPHLLFRVVYVRTIALIGGKGGS
jgi:SAM-dependent methyltransferase